MKTLPNYAVVADSLVATDTNCSAARIHGAMCASICSDAKADNMNCVDKLFSPLMMSGVIRQLFDITCDQFISNACQFELLLPLPSEVDKKHVVALVDWCSGFLAGFDCAFTLLTDRQQLEIHEKLDDIYAISEIDNKMVDGREQDLGFNHLVCYLKRVVSLIYAELQLADTEDIHLLDLIKPQHRYNLKKK